jgi:hypothetical protein
MQASIVERMRVIVSSPAHVPAKACPGLDPGSAPVRRQEHAPLNQFAVLVALSPKPHTPGKAILATETAIDKDGWLDPGYDFDTAVR